MTWISVDDRLPAEDKCWVLVFAGGAINCMAYYRGEWDDWCMAQSPNIHTEDITHWMPLPAPPTGI